MQSISKSKKKKFQSSMPFFVPKKKGQKLNHLQQLGVDFLDGFSQQVLLGHLLKMTQNRSLNFMLNISNVKSPIQSKIVDFTHLKTETSVLLHKRIGPKTQSRLLFILDVPISNLDAKAKKCHVGTVGTWIFSGIFLRSPTMEQWA